MFSSSKNSKHDARFSLICTGNLGFLFLILTCLPDVVRLFSKSVMNRASLRSSERFSTCSVEVERGPFSTLFNQFRRVSSCTARQFSSTLRVIFLPCYITGQIRTKGRSNCSKSYANSATPFFSNKIWACYAQKYWASAQFNLSFFIIGSSHISMATSKIVSLDLLSYLQTLPPALLSRLYQHPPACLAVYR